VVAGEQERRAHGPGEKDGVLIVPILEEQPVIATRLILKEEIRITRKSRTEIVREPVRLRSERAEVVRLEGRDPDLLNPEGKEPRR
jgi:stress response protein YsnF